MDLTDILSQYLHEIHYEELKTDADYQAAKETKNTAERELIAAMQPKQRRLFHHYMETVQYMDALELRRFFSHCTLLLLPPRN